MTKLLILLLLVLVVALYQPVFAQEKTQPKFKLVEFQMALLKRGPNWTATKTGEHNPIRDSHYAYFQSLVESGKAVLAGPLDDDGEIKDVYVFRSKSQDEARAWAKDDPAVKAGHLSVEMHPWWSEEVMKSAAMPLKLAKSYLAFLTRGPKWTPEKTAATEEIQRAHLGNIKRLAEMKKLVVAGPFGDNGRLRGIFVFKVDSLEEAKALANTDPAVQAGRLALEIHPWLVPEGMLP
ncbi:MAG TPA: YciI family protein [Pyrinomonadaceae bacterium]|nr:YciI family protein [Pyrinomonadaceae bacterium]